MRGRIGMFAANQQSNAVNPLTIGLSTEMSNPDQCLMKQDAGLCALRVGKDTHFPSHSDNFLLPIFVLYSFLYQSKHARLIDC